MQRAAVVPPALCVLLACGCAIRGLAPELALTGTPSASEAEAADPSYARRLSDAFQMVSETVGPAVVSVRSYGSARRGRSRQQGSGVLVRATAEGGIVVTNNHVVKDGALIYVSLGDGRDLTAELVGTDPATDLAVLRVSAEDLTVAELEASDQLSVGEWVLAMGNPYGLGHTVTAGVVGGLGVSGLDIANYEDFIQTDAAINPGNSGGPLVNLEGRVVGINTAIGTEAAGTLGIAYAIPSRIVRGVVEGLLADGIVRRGWIGAQWSWLSRRQAGELGFEGKSRVVVRTVFGGSPAQSGGLRDGDVLLGVGGRAITTESEAETLVAESRPGETLAIQVWRAGRLVELSLVPTERKLD